jgi:hypothetical protein
MFCGGEVQKADASLSARRRAKGCSTRIDVVNGSGRHHRGCRAFRQSLNSSRFCTCRQGNCLIGGAPSCRLRVEDGGRNVRRDTVTCASELSLMASCSHSSHTLRTPHCHASSSSARASRSHVVDSLLESQALRSQKKKKKSRSRVPSQPLS